MATRASLSSMVKAAATVPATRPAATVPNETAEPAQAGSRAGRVLLASYQTVETAKQVKLLAVEEGTTMQALMAEALNLVFEKYGKPAIAKP